MDESTTAGAEAEPVAGRGDPHSVGRTVGRSDGRIERRSLRSRCRFRASDWRNRRAIRPSNGPTDRLLGWKQNARHHGHDQHQDDCQNDASFHDGLSGHRVEPARVEGVAAGHTLHAEPAPLHRPVACDCFEGVVRAGGSEATLGEHQMRERHLVAADECHHSEPRPATHAHVTWLTPPVNSARSPAKEAAYAERFARTTRSIAGTRASSSRLSNSLRRRRRRLRATAVNWKRGTMMPTRGWCARVGRQANSRCVPRQ